MSKQLMKPEAFAVLVIDHRDKYNCSYMEAIIEVCEDLGFETEDVGGLIPQYLQDAMEPELRKLHMLNPNEVTDIMTKFGGVTND